MLLIFLANFPSMRIDEFSSVEKEEKKFETRRLPHITSTPKALQNEAQVFQLLSTM
jgi:hypothetical protein